MKCEKIPFKIRAILGKVTLPCESYHTLSQGDIVILDQKIEEPLQVTVGVNEALCGYAGLKEGKRAIKIEAIY